MDVDASQYAMGACLYQINEKEEKNIILFASKAFDDERGKTFTTASPFYREARAVAHFMKEVRSLTALSPFKLLVHSDHLPLTWMKLSKRSTICDFVLFDMGGMDYEILYKPGKSNIVADALSRFPMIGPNKFHLKGLVQAMKTLLRTAPMQACVKDKFWLTHHTRRDTLELARALREWQGRAAKPPLLKAPKSATIVHGDYDFALLLPEAHTAPSLARKMLTTSKNFAILIPTDLIHQIAHSSPEDNKHEAYIQERVDRASKIVLASTGCTWLFRVAKHAKIQKVLAIKIPARFPLSGLQLKEFIAKQDMNVIKAHHPAHEIHVRNDGLTMIKK